MSEDGLMWLFVSLFFAQWGVWALADGEIKAHGLHFRRSTQPVGFYVSVAFCFVMTVNGILWGLSHWLEALHRVLPA